MGWVDPRVGLGWVGIFSFLVGWVGSWVKNSRLVGWVGLS